MNHVVSLLLFETLMTYNYKLSVFNTNSLIVFLNYQHICSSAFTFVLARNSSFPDDKHYINIGHIMYKWYIPKKVKYREREREYFKCHWEHEQTTSYHSTFFVVLLQKPAHDGFA